MAVAFFSDESECIRRKLSVSDDYEDEAVEFDSNYEIDRCAEWINRNNFRMVGLQFPNNLFKDAADVAKRLEQETEADFFVVGDESFGSCCVDEVALQHISADGVIHFGHSCLSPTQRFPVLYIFGKSSLDVQNATSEFRRLFPDVNSQVIIYYEVIYSHTIGQIAENLRDYENLIISGLEIPHTESNVEVNSNQVKVRKCQRYFIIPKTRNLEDYCVFYIGSQNQTLTNIMLSFNKCKFYTYDPVEKVAQPGTLDVNKYLRKRYYYIEKTRDANIIGVLAGTLGVSDYLTIIKHLREIIQAAGKIPYTLVVGKVNIAKLANFAEIEVFVSVACMESSVVDCRSFYQPVITPYELEIALNQAREWTGDFVTDFSELLPGAAKHIPPSEVKELEGDVSLITGNLRTVDLLNPFRDEIDDESSAVMKRDSLTVSTIHSQAAGEYLSQRSWKGVEQHLGETPVTDIQEGRKGIACQYDGEEKQNR